jgi:uncharacterized protein (DUF1015 family)
MVSDLSKVICPPYDVITPKEEKEYYRLHPFNMINLILSRPDSSMQQESKEKGRIDRYTHAKNTFSDWLNRGILKEDDRECFYLYEQNYSLGNQKKKRVGFFGLLYLGDKGIFSHEHTREEPKEDRFLLLSKTRANLCPIFVIFRDKDQILNRIYKCSSKKSPFISIHDREEVHRLWRIDQDNLIDKLKESLKDENVYIADGHHRYEVACRYRDLRRKISRMKNFKRRADFNYIMTYFTDSQSKGLTILPIHRAVKIDKLKLESYFEIKETDRGSLFSSMKRLSTKEHIIGMYKDKKFFSLYLKKKDLLDKIDVQVLDSLFKESNLKDEDIIYSQQVNRIIEAVDRKEAKIGFFLNPLKIEQIMEISLKREKLPSKSSYFYPKLPSGLLIYKFKQ